MATPSQRQQLRREFIQTYGPTSDWKTSVRGSQTVRRTRRGIQSLLLVLGTLILLFLFARAAMTVVSMDKPFTVTSTTTYQVKSGDTLWQIAERIEPNQDPRKVVDWIMRVNGLKSAAIVAGQAIQIPSGS